LKDTVSIDVQIFFYNNNNFIPKKIGTVFEKDPNLNNCFLVFYFAKCKISKNCNLVNQYTSQHFLEQWRKQFSSNSKVSKDNDKQKTNYLLRCGKETISTDVF